jgi:hypothetical protein
MRTVPYHGGRARRSSTPSKTLTPAQARVAWKRLCEAVIAACEPQRAGAADAAMSLIDPLRGTPKGSFPLPSGDARGAWAEDLRVQAERWRLAPSAATRTAFAPAMVELAKAVLALCWDLGAAEAAAYRARTGQAD